MKDQSFCQIIVESYELTQHWVRFISDVQLIQGAGRAQRPFAVDIEYINRPEVPNASYFLVYYTAVVKVSSVVKPMLGHIYFENCAYNSSHSSKFSGMRIYRMSPSLRRCWLYYWIWMRGSLLRKPFSQFLASFSRLGSISSSARK